MAKCNKTVEDRLESVLHTSSHMEKICSILMNDDSFYNWAKPNCTEKHGNLGQSFLELVRAAVPSGKRWRKVYPGGKPSNDMELKNYTPNNLRLVNTLWLGHNKIGDDGIAAIGRALESHSSLTDVFVDNNLITSKGVESLCSNLVRAPQIRRLGLHTNRITDSAMLSLVRLLSTPVFSKLEFVFLKNNPISRGTQSIIERESFVVV